MKKRILIVVLIFVSIFALVSMSDTVQDVDACDIPIPNADLPEPPAC